MLTAEVKKAFIFYFKSPVLAQLAYIFSFTADDFKAIIEFLESTFDKEVGGPPKWDLGSEKVF